MNEITLRPYQQECVDLINEKEEGKYLITLATGLGKTIIFSHIQRKGRTLLLSHRDELVHQPQKYFTDCTFGIEKAEIYSNGEDVVSASVQTLRSPQRLSRFSPDEFHTIIIDEAHHAAAPSYKKILNYFTGAKLLIGVTATPNRGDNVRLDDVFDSILYEKSLLWGIRNHYLSNIHCIQIDGHYKLNNVKRTAGDYNLGDLDKSLQDSAALEITADAFLEHCLNRHTLIYCTTIAICLELLKQMQMVVPEPIFKKIAVLTGSTPTEERTQILQDFANGEIICIINCMVLTEGTDLPIADTIINLRPTCNTALYQQMVGRGTRLFTTKDHCLVIDIAPEISPKTRNMCLAPSLFGIDLDKAPKRLKDQFQKEEIDLVECCDQIQKHATDVSNLLEMHIEEFQMFENDRFSIINMYSNLHDIVKAYEEMDQLIEDDIDFQNLIVHSSPNVDERYVIHPNFSDRITLSAPDLLGHVVMSFELSQGRKEIHASRTMKLEEAIPYIIDYCQFLPSLYACAWNQNIAANWKQYPATDNQLSGLTNKPLFKNKQGFDDLNKYEAAMLYNMAQAITEAKRNTKKYIKFRGKNTDEIEDFLQSQTNPEEINDANWNYIDKIVETQRQIPVFESQENVSRNKIQYHFTRITTNYDATISKQQMSLIQRIYSSKQVVIEGLPNLEALTCLQASIVISILLQTPINTSIQITKKTFDTLCNWIQVYGVTECKCWL